MKTEQLLDLWTIQVSALLFREQDAFLKNLLSETDGAEYIDFYCAGINEEDVYEAGFVEVNEEDGNIIPNYFEPFVQENIDIWVDSREYNSLFTKADADQDRPNII